MPESTVYDTSIPWVSVAGNLFKVPPCLQEHAVASEFPAFETK